MSSWYDRIYCKPSYPHKVKGGIKAQTKRGSFGQSWWAKRWIGVLESFNIGARLGRGRTYARSGQVVSIDIEKGFVTAYVQGSRRTPYSVKINVKTLSEQEWKKIAEALSGQAFFVAKLLVGEMPENIEEIFNAVKLSLFPEKLKDLTTNCSCPDWSNPCKHIAAVYYLLGEEFDRDPFLIFKLRGMDRDELLSIMDVSSVPNNADQSMQEPVQEQEAQLPPEPLTSDPMSFWGQAKTADFVSAEVSVPTIPGTLAKRLGAFPLWRGQQNFLEFLEDVYAKTSPVGLEIFLGETGTDVSLK